MTLSLHVLNNDENGGFDDSSFGATAEIVCAPRTHTFNVDIHSLHTVLNF